MEQNKTVRMLRDRIYVAALDYVRNYSTEEKEIYCVHRDRSDEDNWDACKLGIKTCDQCVQYYPKWLNEITHKY